MYAGNVVDEASRSIGLKTSGISIVGGVALLAILAYKKKKDSVVKNEVEMQNDLLASMIWENLYSGELNLIYPWWLSIFIY